MIKRKAFLTLILICYLFNLAFAQAISTIESDSIQSRKFRLDLSAEVEATVYNKIDTSIFKNVVDVVKLGFTTDYLISEKWNLHADFLVKRTKEDLIVPIDSTEGNMSDFDFGLIEINHFYRLNKFYFFETALILNRKISERHSLGLGVGMSYLLTIKGQLVRNQRKIVNNRTNGELKIVDVDGVINEGIWDKDEEIVTSLLSFMQIRYDFKSSQNSTVFLKLNGRYDSDNYLQRPWLTEQDKFLQIAASLGFYYQF